jgi:hypothetical protein
MLAYVLPAPGDGHAERGVGPQVHIKSGSPGSASTWEPTGACQLQPQHMLQLRMDSIVSLDRMLPGHPYYNSVLD